MNPSFDVGEYTIVGNEVAADREGARSRRAPSILVLGALVAGVSEYSISKAAAPVDVDRNDRESNSPLTVLGDYLGER